MAAADLAEFHGYSGKPLFQKIGLKPGMRCLAINPPDHFHVLMQGATGVEFFTERACSDVVHLFCIQRSVLERDISDALSLTVSGGMLWVSWPKKSSKMFVDLTEDVLREVILPTGWVDVKVCAVDQDWSGLKFLRRRS